MNKLSNEKRAQILAVLCEGMSNGGHGVPTLRLPTGEGSKYAGQAIPGCMDAIMQACAFLPVLSCAPRSQDFRPASLA